MKTRSSLSTLLGLLLIVSLLGSNLPVRAALPLTRYLAPTGSDSGDCTSASAPCQSVQYAINQAGAGDELHLAAGTYPGPQTLGGHTQVALVDKSLGLYGGYVAGFTSRSPQTSPTILDAGGLGRIIYASGAISLTLDGLQMANGNTQADPGGLRAGGGIYASGVSLVISDCLLKDSRSGSDYGYGSGLYVSGGSLKLDGSVVQGNSSFSGSSQGGGLYAINAQVELTNSSFLNNTAAQSGYLGNGYGGGAYLESSNAVIREVTFQGNQAASGSSGSGGGLASLKGSLQLLDSTFEANTGCTLDGCYGGGIYLRTANAEIRGSTFTGNIASTKTGSSSLGGGITIRNYWGVLLKENRFENNQCRGCGGGGVYVWDFGPVQLENNQFTGNSASSGGAVGLGGPSSASSQAILRGNRFEDNQASGDGGAVYFYGTVDLLSNQFVSNHANGNGGAVYQGEGSSNEVGSVVFDGNLLQGNSAGADGGGLYLKPTFSANLKTVYRNMAFTGNQAAGKGGAILIWRYTNTPTSFLHLTFSGNTAGDGSTINNFMGRLELTNVILANAATGILNRNSLALEHILFDGVSTPVLNQAGVVTLDNRVSGRAGLDADGYHLTASSGAVDAGVSSTLITDIDGEPRPLGTAPDLGADESPFSAAASGMQAWILASQPEWKIKYTGTSVPPSTVFEQNYLIPFANYHPSLAAASYGLHDQFPAALPLAASAARPDLNYSPSGSSLNWNSLAPLYPGQWGWISLTGRSDTITPGTVLNSSGQLEYILAGGASGSIPFAAQTTVPVRPLFPPLLLSPRTGEMCLDEAGQLSADGLSSAGGIVRLYENGVLKGSTTANSDGEYSLSWTSALSPTQKVEVHALACEPGGACSSPSRSVILKYPEGNWCPQRSYWEGEAYGIHYEFHFRNEAGAYATQDFLIPGTAGFANTKLHLYSCCKGEANPFRVLADELTYTAPSGHSGHWWEFDIAGAHNVAIYSDCSGGGSGTTTTSYGTVLIDPDGFVFNQAQAGSVDPVSGMFAPVQPLAGFTVSAYTWAPEWNSWILWPAHLFENQVNPQVTGPSGYYAFFTPPGLYYLQVTGKDGYQTWRSPVVEVKSEVVHLNAPLTGWAGSSPPVQVKVSPAGISQPLVILPVGGSVEWQAGVDLLTPAEVVSGMLETPVQRLLSAANPLLNPLGWDAGRLAPGETYRRQFTQPGAYAYTDGYGHPGQVLVTNQKPVYIAVVRK